MKPAFFIGILKSIIHIQKKLSFFFLFYNFKKKTLASGQKKKANKKFILEAEFWKVVFLLRENLVENLDCKYARTCFEPKGGWQAIKNMPLFTETNKGHLLKCSKTLLNNQLLGSGYFYYLSYSFIKACIKDYIKPLDDLMSVFDSQYLKSEPCEHLWTIVRWKIVAEEFFKKAFFSEYEIDWESNQKDMCTEGVTSQETELKYGSLHWGYFSPPTPPLLHHSQRTLSQRVHFFHFFREFNTVVKS